ncbi:hypothetical protein JOF56_003753 [Kibdelosporangium banguiense]|uniref:Uncharacterized protein n=1 Tax=Kibdelosporangium banguiense TaxID=1365924 RepID=A0ABS4TG13_9PSEU|nr:hypothetical protein [Kibdelosporangium banguiense]MBP2323368.1 hypothetical protein [Kibdelosporangium banguiense]
MAIQPPTFVAAYGPGAYSSATTLTTSVTADSGDVLVLVATSGDANRTISTPTGGSGVNWTPREQVGPIEHYGRAVVWTSSVPSSHTFTVSMTAAGGNPGDNNVSFKVLRFRNSDGIGASAKANDMWLPTLGVPTTQENSALVVATTDWNALPGSSRAWNTAAGPVTEVYYYSGASQTDYFGVYPNVGALGTKTTGLVAPTGQQWSMVAVEVLGTTAPSVALSGSGSLALSSALPHVNTTIPVGAAGSLALLGSPATSGSVSLSGSGPLDIAHVSSGYFGSPNPLTFSGVGALTLDDPNAKPVYMWNGETWRSPDVWVWNGRAWLPIRANDIHIY